MGLAPVTFLSGLELEIRTGPVGPQLCCPNLHTSMGIAPARIDMQGTCVKNLVQTVTIKKTSSDGNNAWQSCTNMPTQPPLPHRHKIIPQTVTPQWSKVARQLTVQAVTITICVDYQFVMFIWLDYMQHCKWDQSYFLYTVFHKYWLWFSTSTAPSVDYQWKHYIKHWSTGSQRSFSMLLT